ncbi:protein kinase domain-containing protein [Lentzea terrae]|uniref:protein kinase domain-containing protein n=1 Tax=Lentzea terrae TaxID=2200761 RepID=UPI00130037E5|nr:serine/threonine-protein kinase [Lentzea terrae]
MAAGPLSGYQLLAELAGDGPVATGPAIREHDGAEVTVHVVTVELDRNSARRFRTEAVALADITSPHLVPLIDHGRADDGRCFFVTERGAGTLADEIPLQLAEFGQVLDTATVALNLLHSKKLVHRGVSPAALVRSPRAGLRLACPTLPVIAELELVARRGTGHEPPEVLQGQDWTPAGDVYGLASTLWTLLVGKPPVETSADLWVARAFADAPRDVPAVIPPQFGEPLRRALARQPGDRPQSGEAFARSLAGTAPPPQELLGGKYVKVKLLGSGGSGEVWQAQGQDGAFVAVKVLLDGLVADHDWHMRLVREWSTLRTIDHPHVIKVREAVLDPVRPFVVMELVEGSDLRQLRAAGKLDRGEALRLLSGGAAGLAAVHEAGLVHRDVKPANILVQEGVGLRHAKLADFGLAKPVDQYTVTRVGDVAGTPAYLAPELARGGRPSAAGDVYALGVTIYEVLAGSRPSPVPVRPDGLPDSLWHIITACLAEQPDARPSAAAVADALADLAVGRSGDLELSAPIPAAATISRTTDQIVPPPALAWHEVAVPVPADEVLPTETGVRPLAEPPSVAVPKKSRRWVWLAGASTAVVGGVIGIVLGVINQDDAKPETKPKPTEYHLKASVSVDQQGAVTVTWPSDANKLSGVTQYAVLRGGRLKGEIPVGRNSFRDVNPDGSGCYTVIALGVKSPPPDPPPEAACLPN